jgi:SHS2 domain-containing protein
MVKKQNFNLGYKFLDDLTSDVMFEAYGVTFEEMLENAATAMFSVICNIKNVQPIQSIGIKFCVNSWEDALYEWLSLLLTQSEIKGLFLSKFEVKIKETNSTIMVSGKAWGEPISREKSGTVVKGITYYGFSVKKTPTGYKSRVAIDI